MGIFAAPQTRLALVTSRMARLTGLGDFVVCASSSSRLETNSGEH